MIFAGTHLLRFRRQVRCRGLVVLLPAALVVLAPAALARTAQAATLTVTTTTDELTSNGRQCSLRQAVAGVTWPGAATECGTASSGANIQEGKGTRE